jgi:hypothetical protein
MQDVSTCSRTNQAMLKNWNSITSSLGPREVGLHIVSVNRTAILGYATIGLNHTADQ